VEKIEDVKVPMHVLSRDCEIIKLSRALIYIPSLGCENMSIKNVREHLLKKTKKSIQKRFESNDIHIVRAVNTLDELDGLFNQLYEQIVEWYSVHFPELARLLSDPETFLQCVVSIGDRKNFSSVSLKKVGEQQRAAKIIAKAQKSNGSSILASALSPIQSTAQTALGLKKQRSVLESFVAAETTRIMPRTTKLLTAILAARLLKEAGSFKRLAMFPSSTVQVLGAEKALFRHKKFGSKPPKHGLLFQHSTVQKAGRDARGKAARSLAGKVSIEVRKDYFNQ
jgi:nucleolar protein 56